MFDVLACNDVSDADWKEFIMILKTGLLIFFTCMMLCGCTKHEIESRHEIQVAPLEVKPIHITIDINIKVDRALDDFFADIDKEQQ